MSVLRAYDRWSTTYDRDINRTRDLDAVVTRKVLAGVRPRTILEIGCGTGKNTSFFAALGGEVHAVDFCRGMIGRAQEKVVAENVRFAVADLTEPWPFSPRAYDLVTFSLILEHIEDLDTVFAETARMLQGKGRVFVCELHPYRQYCGAKAVFDHGNGEEGIPAFQHNVSDFLAAAVGSGLDLVDLKEWWHDHDAGKPPRLLSLVFEKPAERTG